MPLQLGEKLGPYEILAPIGAGGMGEVWKARDTRLDRIVAIKRLKTEHLERFRREARAIAALNHPHICQIYDVGVDYLVMEYVEGAPLKCPLPAAEASRLGIQIASALEEAHAKGIIHRDLKPGNILITPKGDAKLLDFGLAKLVEPGPPDDAFSTLTVGLTEAGAVVGTVAYMSPEQAQGQTVDARSDIFSFGLVLYEVLSGKRAFTGETPFATMSAIVREEPAPMQAPAALQRIVQRCLAKQPSSRFQTMTEVKTELEKAEVKPADQGPSIAVLPFANMSADKENEYFSDGLAEEIIELSGAGSGPEGDRTDLRVCVQGAEYRHSPDRRNVGCGEHSRRQRAQSREPHSRHSPVDQRDRREPSVVPALRPRAGGCVRGAGRNRRGHRRSAPGEARHGAALGTPQTWSLMKPC